MDNNIKKPQQGITPIPCKPLVAILGWAMELQHTYGIPTFQETNKLMFETFIVDPSACDATERSEALMFYNEITELCNLLQAITPEEATQLNQFLLNVCEEEMKKPAA